ncbi:MAG: hypothetical protein COA52_10455 [Hyphomicrobiales bacterium]|nr:hypothetical protein [Hyphomicrobiales bacterium]PCJ90333.1 MAG: hypothetical protein COA52_10455 [Hyphomicrobiales bacterium]
MTSIAVDILVCILLVVTIGYCSVLNRRLKRLRDEESIMRATVQEMVNTSALADRALKDLRTMAETTDATLHSRIIEAEKLAKYLAGFTPSNAPSVEPAVMQPAIPEPHIGHELANTIPSQGRGNSPIFANLRASAQRLSARAPQ